MSPNISKPSATLVPLFSKIYSPPSRPLPFFPLFIPLPRIFTPSSFGIAKVLPFLIPTKCFHNFFLSPHFNTLIPTKKFFTQFPASIAISVGSYQSLWQFPSPPKRVSMAIFGMLRFFIPHFLLPLCRSITPCNILHTIIYATRTPCDILYYMFSIPLFYHHINCNRLSPFRQQRPCFAVFHGQSVFTLPLPLAIPLCNHIFYISILWRFSFIR